MNQKFIVIDGKTYKSVDEMPEDIRQKYEAAMRNLDKNQNGVPDMLENRNVFEDKNNDGIPDVFAGISRLTTSTKIMVNGQEVNSLDQLPPEIRAKYEQAMSKLDANHNGVPDFMEGMIQTPMQTTNSSQINFGTQNPPAASPQSFDYAQAQPITASPTIEPDSTGSRWLLILAGVVLIGLCLVGAAAIWYFYLR